MSIWCSWEHIGTDPMQWYEVTSGVREADVGGAKPKGRKVPKVAERGTVLSYANGFSNHYPTLDGTCERPAAIAVASIAPWCTPGHDEDCARCERQHDHPDAGGWLRLEVAAPETLNFWTKDADGNPTIESEDATVVLDVAAVTALRDDLNAWLALNHLEPEETA